MNHRRFIERKKKPQILQRNQWYDSFEKQNKRRDYNV